jgi:fibro-slime domain-containing protein
MCNHFSKVFFILALSLAACSGRPSINTSERTAAHHGGKGGKSGTAKVGGAESTTIDISTEAGGTSPCEVDGCGAGATAGAGPGQICGDSRIGIDEGESCDDGNSTPGDGCDGLCHIEPGYDCTVPGQLCTIALTCGDGKLGPNEACDDGNAIDGDGCTKCAVDLGYECNQFGVVCVKTTTPPVCGNKGVEAGETCDDGNTLPGDGCSATCQLEAGWLCPKPGLPCTRDEFCGDGILNGTEQCDDRNHVPGDGCNGNCQLESNWICVTPIPALVPPHQVCSTTVVCGDIKVTGSEVCDDGNTKSGDGCTEDCSTVEPGYGCPPAGGACTKAVNPCGNAQIDAGEECDDGQSPPVGGDGCSSDCKVEAGFVCPTPGTACKTIEFCGDGKVNFSLGETCDDGNKIDGDGCSALCHVEPGFRCTGAPSKCETAVVCGDKKILGSETCDDGNQISGDGCSSACKLENGYLCPIVGIACQAVCGDGILAGREQCDDKNSANGDGCTGNCTIEGPADTEGNGWNCPTPGSTCVRTTCGNNVPEGSEQCDDGNNDAGDGCTPFCRREPTCPAAGGACSTACGDGILLPIDKTTGQECDDGNTVSGDGCSATCKIESGYACPDEVVTKTTLILPVILRDFKASNETNGHPDFQQYNNGHEPGIVQNLLDANGKPQHVHANMRNTDNAYDAAGNLTSVTDFFAIWYRDNPDYNKTVLQTLTFTQLTTGEYQYANTSFFPLTGLGWGNYRTTGKNFHFTSEVRYWFEYKGGETLKFTGDDDVWVFVNKQLAVDLGGVHSAINGSVVLDPATGAGNGTVCENAAVGCTTPKTVALGLAIGSVYEIVVFQAERHTDLSNYTLTLGKFTATRSKCSPVCGDGIVTGNEQCDLGASKNVGGYGGCDANCMLGPFCGDGLVDATHEVCDDGVNATPYATVSSGCAPDCRNHYCGDGIVDTDFGEACDLASLNSAAAYGPGQCSTSCQAAPFCGDGNPNGPEQCDQGAKNGTPTSTCDTQCRIKCGNAVVDAGEQCDNGAALNNSIYGGCRNNCTLAPYCGDGFKNGTEQCDDGKNDGTYGTCKSDCTFADYCGDGVTNPAGGEVCDLGAANVTDKYGPGLCTTRCLPAPFCGDSAVDAQFGEKCDDGAANSDTIAGACKTDCSGYNTPPAACGNGVLDSGEQCDAGAANGTPTSSCDQRCKYKCGNGIKDPGEQCDDGKNTGAYGTCKPDCTLSDYCGDGMKNGPEQCDRGLGNELAPYGMDKCTKQCTLAPYCGDDRLQSPPEECDGQSGCLPSCRWGNILQ